MYSLSQFSLGSISMTPEQAFSDKNPMSLPLVHSSPFSLKSFFLCQEIEAGGMLCKP